MGDRAPKRARLQLSESRAWEILQQVTKPLFGCVKLDSSSEEASEFRIIHSYDWIELDVPLPTGLPKPHLRNALAWVQQAREACVVWHLISCCAGFSGAENPVFWKRVVDSLLEDPHAKWGATAPFRPSEAVDDAHRFFTDIGAASFPRFRLKLECIDQYYRVESYSSILPRSNDTNDRDGMDDISIGPAPIGSRKCDNEGQQADRVEGNGEDDTEATPALQKLVQEILPHVDTTRYYARDSLHLAIALTDFFSLDDVGSTLAGLEDNLVCEGDYNDDAVSTLDFLCDGCIVFPCVQLKSIAFANPEPYHDDEELACLSEILRESPVEIPEIDIAVTDMLSDDAFSKFLCTALHFRESEESHLRVLSFLLDAAAQHQIEMIFSVLPLSTARGPSTVRIHPQRYDGSTTLSGHAWAWIVYALCHPLRLSRPLALPRVRSTANSTAQTERQSSGRSSWWLAHQFTMRGKKHSSWDKSCEVYAVVKTGCTTVSALPRSVCVVVPGGGRAWVSKTHITSVSDAGEMQVSTLVRLRLSSPQSHSHNTCIAFPEFPAMVQSLNYLDMSSFGVASSDQLEVVARTCPKLQCLGLAYEWKEGNGDQGYQGVKLNHLRTPKLVCSKTVQLSMAPWREMLPDLTELHVMVLDEPLNQNLHTI